jgi:inner membrane protein
VNQFIGNIIKRDITVKFTKTTIAIAYFGVLTHLFLDYFTTLGIPLFFPFSITRYALNLYQSLDLITIILAAIVMIIIYMKVNYKYKKAAMAIFMIILISFGGLRAYEKINILDDETPTLNGNYNQVSLYPTSNIFVWNVVKSNSQNSSYIVSEYNGWSNQESNIQTFNTPSVENGNYSAGLNAIKIADTLPVVKQFKWNSYYTIVNARYNSTKWDVTYSDIVNSYTANNLTDTVP